MKPVKAVLVIKLSALGDFVMAFPAFARIRAAHPDARITLLTTPPFDSLAKLSPYFDQVDTGGRPNGPAAWFALAARLRRGRFDRVYDLQTNDRTNLLFQALRPSPPAWSGVAPGASLPHRNRARKAMHPLERHAEQLAHAGIWPDAPTAPLSAEPPDISWILKQALARSQSSVRPSARPLRPTALLVPGSSAHRTEKRWPVASYGALAARLEAEGFEVLILGGLQEAELARAIQRLAPRARDLTGRTDFAQIAAHGARAAVAIGNDTGPVHLIAAAGAPTIVLFSSASSPELSAPRGHVTVFQAPDLKDVAVETVLASALSLARPETPP
ncbi:MAG TPA: glycosyltransferase family 9 protein [Caulobacteraceae bacterium]